MKNQIKAFLILFLTVTFSAFAAQTTLLNDDEPVIAIYKGFSEDKGFTFTINEGEEEKELSFPKVDEAILESINLKDEALVGQEFELILEAEKEGTLHLKDLKKVEKEEE